MFLRKSKGGFDWLIVGLGNPGLQYENTRHNAGFIAADVLADKFGMKWSKSKFDSIYGDCYIGNEKIIIAKPQTYMNLSGKAVSALAHFYKIPCDRIIIMFDDISLPIGKIRIRRKGSAGGHNGIKDVIELLGTEEIMRIKIGVGEKPHPDYDLKDWVLGKIPDANRDGFNKAVQNASDAVFEIINRGIDSAMNKYSR